MKILKNKIKKFGYISNCFRLVGIPTGAPRRGRCPHRPQATLQSDNLKYTQKFLFIFLLIISGSVLFISCGKKFLEEKPRTVSLIDLMNSPDGGLRMVAAIYNKLYDFGEYSFSWIGVSSITSDDADKGSDIGDTGTDKDQLDNWTFTPSSLSFAELWLNNFQGIGRATYALKYLPDMNTPDKERLIGESEMLRANFYWNLVRIFGGVPIIDHVLTSEVEIESATVRATKDEVYAYIEKDLMDAITKLPPTIPVAENGRVTKYAAEALLAKVYLYEKKWAESKAMCDDIINSHQYALDPDYSKIWREVGEFSQESIWEINAIGTQPNLGIWEYFLVQAPRGANGLGWGFNTPSQDLVNAYEPGDVREAGTIMFRGETLWDGYVVSPQATNERYNYKSYVSKTKESYDGDDVQTNKNLRLFRFGEILLIKAEVENELGNMDVAKQALDSVRHRAGLASTTANNQTDLRDSIYKERRVEMAFEHDRMFDLQRTGRAGAVLRALGKPYKDGVNDVFPIPQIEINLSNGKLTQNPGY